MDRRAHAHWIVYKVAHHRPELRCVNTSSSANSLIYNPNSWIHRMKIFWPINHSEMRCCKMSCLLRSNSCSWEEYFKMWVLPLKFFVLFQLFFYVCVNLFYLQYFYFNFPMWCMCSFCVACFFKKDEENLMMVGFIFLI